MPISQAFTLDLVMPSFLASSACVSDFRSLKSLILSAIIFSPRFKGKVIFEILYYHNDIYKGSTCTFKLKKAGKAKVTFKSDIGTYVYNITVYNKKSDPIRAGFIEMNSADGIEPTLFIANNSGKSIKYVDFNATFYNAVGDKVRNDIGNSYSKALQIIGLIKPWTMDYFKWDPVFYSPVVKRMYVKSATITYMDGSKKTVSIRKSFSYSKKDANKYYKYI